MKNTQRKIMSVILIMAMFAGLIPGLLDSFTLDVSAAPGTTEIIPGEYTLNGGAKSGFNYFHMVGTGAKRPGEPEDAFWQDTFCTHKDYNSGSGSYVYYYNANPGETAASNPLFYTNVLNQGTAVKNGIEMTVAQYRDLRYCILYTNVNRDSFGQYAYWSYLAEKIPERYSYLSGRAPWDDDWEIKYFGAKADPNFMGLGAIADGQTIDIGAEIGVQFSGPTVVTLSETSGRAGPFKVEWTPGSDPVLAQLNCGPNKDSVPMFMLSASSSAVRFYSTNTSRVPISNVRLGGEFYIEYNPNAKTGGTVTVTVSSNKNFMTKVIADQFFIHPRSQNQINVDTETQRMGSSFSVTVPIPAPSPVPDHENDYDYVRPTVEKQVAVDNHVNVGDGYVDVLTVAPGTDVIHKMTVTSDDPKGTILTFQNMDYDLYPSVLFTTEGDVPTDTALVYDATQFKSAIDANKNIKLMADITLPNSWVASSTVYSGIFDGNGYLLIGGDAMTEPVFRHTLDAVFYRVSFVGFKMTREDNYSTATFKNGVGGAAGGGRVVGTLVDDFDSTASSPRARMIDCYVQGFLKPKANSLSINVGGVAGNIYAREIYGVKALIDIDFESLCNQSNGIGGVFSVAAAHIFENVELMTGSNLNLEFKNQTGSVASQFIAGISDRLYMFGDEREIRNCSADYSIYLNFEGGVINGGYMTHAYISQFGGMVRSLYYAALVDRCSVRCEYIGKDTDTRTDTVTEVLFQKFGGLARVSGDAGFTTYSNCFVEFDDLVNTMSGSGIVYNDSPSGFCFNFENCYANINIQGNRGNSNIAGILYSANSVNNPSFNNCFTEGSLTLGTLTESAANAAIGGITTAGINSGFIGSITNCGSSMAMGDNGLANARIGGIWGNRSTTYTSEVMKIKNCLFAGEIETTGSSSTAKEIYNCDIVACSGSNNYTVTASMDDETGPDGQTIDISTFDTAATALAFFRTGLGWGDSAIIESRPGKTGALSPVWYMENKGTSTTPYWLPALATAYRWPAQRIYVTDYYDQNNEQEFIEHLYIWNGTAFEPLWDAGVRMSGTNASDPYASVDFYMAPGDNTFDFYYFIGDNSKSSGEDGPWDNTGEWQNTVKITPRDNVLIFDGGDKSKPTLDWFGAYDDDWVLCEDAGETLEIRLNIIKMTTVANYPMPLDGCEFTLYKSNSVFGSRTLVDTLKPSDYIGLDYADRPVLTDGCYVLVETGAPTYYSNNVDNKWYLIVANGEVRMYEDTLLIDEIPLGEERGVFSYGVDTLIYGAHIENNMNTGVPTARISLVKWNEDGSEEIFGETLTENGMPWFTGAVYSMRKYEGDDWTGAKFGYGNMLVYGEDIGGAMMENCVDIIPGYYELVEIRAPYGYATDPTPIYIHFDGDTLNIKTDTHAEVEISGKTATINAKNAKQKYEITLNKYNSDDDEPIAGIAFKLINAANNTVIDTFTTVGANGEVTVTLPYGDGRYIISEILTSSQYYTKIPDYTVEVSNGEMSVRGGPHGYDFTVVRGQRDDQYYISRSVRRLSRLTK